MLDERLPDLVLTDLDMPHVNGLELVEAVCQRHPRIPVILMTAYGTDQTAVQALEHGAASYVPKRNLAHDLIDTIAGVMSVVQSSREQDRVSECLAESSSCFLLANDSTLVPPLVGRLQQQLERTRLFNENVLLRVSLALREALINAIEHGNLEVGSYLRERDDDSYLHELRRRREVEPYRSRRVMLSARETRDEVTYVIRDDGPGFDTTSVPDPTNPENLLKASGRGLLLIRAFMDEVSHNATGNEITLIKRRCAD
jgi:CheY-like chemotaxis protein